MKERAVEAIKTGSAYIKVLIGLTGLMEIAPYIVFADNNTSRLTLSPIVLACLYAVARGGKRIAQTNYAILYFRNIMKEKLGR